jgi:hypothetical protein
VDESRISFASLPYSKERRSIKGTKYPYILIAITGLSMSIILAVTLSALYVKCSHTNAISPAAVPSCATDPPRQVPPIVAGMTIAVRNRSVNESIIHCKHDSLTQVEI